MTEAARQLHRAAAYWAFHMQATGQPIPTGYVDAARSLVSAADDRPAWLAPSEAAAHAGVSIRTIRRWRAAGLPSSSRGRVVRIAATDLDAWLADPGGQPHAPGVTGLHAAQG